MNIIKYLKDAFSSNKGSRFRQNFIRIAKANIFAQALPLISMPLLTRLYSPDDFGKVFLFNTALNFFLIFATWRVEWSIPNSKNEEEATGLFTIGFLFLLTICSLLVFLILSVDICLLLDKTKFANLCSYLIYLPMALLGAGSVQIAVGNHIKLADMRSISTATITQSILTTILTIVSGFLGFGAIGLIVNNIVGFWARAIILLKALKMRLFLLKPEKILNVWSNHKVDCSTSVLVGAVNYAFLSFLPLALATNFSVKDVGYYAIASRMTYPVSLISNSLSESFWAESSKLIKENPVLVRNLYKKTLLRLSLLSILPILICVSGPLYLGVLFGQETWSKAGIVLVAITPQVIGGFIFSSTNHLVVYGKQKYQLISDSITVIFCLTWLVISHKLGANFFVTILFISFIVLFGYILRFFLHLKANSNYKYEKNNV